MLFKRKQVLQSFGDGREPPGACGVTVWFMGYQASSTAVPGVLLQILGLPALFHASHASLSEV